MIEIPVGVTVRPLLIETRFAPTHCCLIGERIRLSYLGIMIFISFYLAALTLSQTQPRIGEH